MKKTALIIFLLATFICSLNAQTVREIFVGSNKAYEKGDYMSAISGYESLVAQGRESSSLYYNLANAYFKAGKPGLAILNYERARIFSPADDDIKFNLEYVKSSFLQEDQKTKNPLTEFAKSIYDILSINSLGIVFTVVFMLLLISLGVCFFRKVKFLSHANFYLGIIVVVVGVWFATKAYQTNLPWAIIVQPDCNIRSGPGTEYQTGYLIPEGKKVLILRTKEDWVEIGLKEEGIKGWTENNKIEMILKNR